MIGANELRVNSLISYKNDNGIFELDAIEILAKGINVIHNGGVWFVRYEELQPIELAEERLLKFGFEKKGVTFRKGKYILWFNGTSESEYAFMVYDERDGLSDGTINDLKVFSTKLTYVSSVHRLQNLWFELENEELKMPE